MPHLIHVLILAGIYSILCMSLNLLVGYTGLLSVAHAAFNGIGAYAVAILLTQAGWSFFPALLIGVLLAMLVALLMGLVLGKFKDDYYTIATVGFGIIAVSVFRNWQSLTRGPLGILGIPRPEIFGFQFSTNVSFLLLVTAFALLVYLACRKINNSSLGRVLKAVRDDEDAIKVFGYDTYYFKMFIFTISAGMAAISGGLLASYLTFIDPGSFVLIEAITMVVAIILGGLASLNGSVVGAAVLILLPEALRFVGLPSDIAAQMRQVLFGLALILLMLYRPQGLLGEYKL